MKFVSTVVITFAIFIVAACTKDKGTNTPPFTPDCNGAAVSFSNNVLPIFQSVCSQRDCHNSGSVNGPGPLTTYAEINAARGNIRAAVLSGFMPKNTTLTAAQKNSIICWVDAGAQNN
jgi:hypothetical protein